MYAIGAGPIDQLEQAIEDNPALIDEPLYEGFYSIHIASKSDRLDVVTLFLEHGADPNERGGFYHATPLISAIESQNNEMVGLLLDRGADPNLSMADGTSILEYAKKVGTKESIKLIEASIQEK